MTALALIGCVSSIVGEITGTASLRTASIGGKVWWISVGGGYLFAFAMPSVALAQRLPLGVAYGI